MTDAKSWPWCSRPADTFALAIDRLADYIQVPGIAGDQRDRGRLRGGASLKLTLGHYTTAAGCRLLPRDCEAMLKLKAKLATGLELSEEVRIALDGCAGSHPPLCRPA